MIIFFKDFDFTAPEETGEDLPLVPRLLMVIMFIVHSHTRRARFLWRMPALNDFVCGGKLSDWFGIFYDASTTVYCCWEQLMQAFKGDHFLW